MNRKVLIYGGFFVVLVLVFWALLKMLIPGFGTVKLPVLNKVQPFAFTDEHGKPLSEKDVEGKVYVTEYFFTTCSGICPKMNLNMKKVFEKYGNEPRFAILSHTSMPETDSVPKMLAYEKKLLGDNTQNNWHFLTGSKGTLYAAARDSYLLDDEKNKNYNINDQFIHTQFFALVDKERRVRAIYDGLKKDEVNKLLVDVKRLLDE